LAPSFSTAALTLGYLLSTETVIRRGDIRSSELGCTALPIDRISRFKVVFSKANPQPTFRIEDEIDGGRR
jgi:hypothetical protein